MKYIFDPGQAITSLSKKQLQICVRGAAIVIGNDYEIEYVFGKIGNNPSQPPLSLRGGERGVIIRTLGIKGSEIIFPNGKKIRISIARVKHAVDPTGAGDAYRAGLLYGLVQGFDLKKSAELGATAASFAVERHGTQNHKFNYGILVRRHNRNFSSKL